MATPIPLSGANYTVTKMVEILMSATTADMPSQSSVDMSTESAAVAAQSQPSTDVSTESSVTMVSNTPIHAGALTMPSSQQGPMPEDLHNIVPMTSANQGFWKILFPSCKWLAHDCHRHYQLRLVQHLLLVGRVALSKLAFYHQVTSTFQVTQPGNNFDFFTAGFLKPFWVVLPN